MSLRQEGSVGNANRIYTFRHAADMSLGWVDQRSFVVNPWVLSPNYGTYDYSSQGAWITEHDVYYVVAN